MSVVDELEAELIAFYTVREPAKAHTAFVRQLLRDHPAEHIAVSLSNKYGNPALWESAPRWAMVAEAAAPEPGDGVPGFVAKHHQTLFAAALMLLLLFLLWPW